jgi:hypothetical protein
MMTEQDILSADPTNLVEDDLDELIGAATSMIKRLQSDREGTIALRQRLTARIGLIRTVLLSARQERRGRG